MDNMEELNPVPSPGADGEEPGNLLPPAEEPIFINVTRMDRERYFEAVRSRDRSARSVTLSIGGVIVAVVGLLMGNYLVAALGAVITVLTLLSPALIGRRDYRRLCRRHPGGEWTKTLRFYEDRMETDDGAGGVRSALYSSIRREAETEHMYILEFGKELPATAFDKSAFTKGSMEELRPFLTEARRRVYAPGAEEETNRVD